MNFSLRCIVALAALSGFTSANADQTLTFSIQASEVQVKNVILPLSSTSALVETPCPGCSPRSHATTATTQFFINKDAVTVEELRSAVAGKPDLVLTVLYVIKSGNLVSVTADLPNRAAAPPRPRATATPNRKI
jgi:hypothetical protein